MAEFMQAVLGRTPSSFIWSSSHSATSHCPGASQALSTTAKQLVPRSNPLLAMDLGRRK